MVFLKLLIALALLLFGIEGVCLAGHAFMKSSEPGVDGVDVVLYGIQWVVGLISGIILCIAGVFFVAQAFL